MADTENKTNIPSKERKKQLKDSYQGRGAFANRGPAVSGAGGTQAKDRGDRGYAATGQRQPEGQKPGLLDRIRQRGDERRREQQQRQYAQELAQQKQNEKRMGRVGGNVGRAGAALAKGTPLGKSFGAMAKNSEGMGRGMGRMAEREAAMKRLNDQKRQAWRKEKGLKNKAKAFLKRPKKQRGVTPRKHSKVGWLILIGMAMFKDALDIGTIELISWIDWIVDAGIGVTFFFMLGRGNVQFAQKIVRSLLPALVEMIPILGIAPVWTFSVLYIYFRSEIETKLPAAPEKKELPG